MKTNEELLEFKKNIQCSLEDNNKLLKEIISDFKKPIKFDKDKKLKILIESTAGLLKNNKNPFIFLFYTSCSILGGTVMLFTSLISLSLSILDKAISAIFLPIAGLKYTINNNKLNKKLNAINKKLYNGNPQIIEGEFKLAPIDFDKGITVKDELIKDEPIKNKPVNNKDISLLQ